MAKEKKKKRNKKHNFIHKLDKPLEEKKVTSKKEIVESKSEANENRDLKTFYILALSLIVIVAVAYYLAETTDFLNQLQDKIKL